MKRSFQVGDFVVYIRADSLHKGYILGYTKNGYIVAYPKINSKKAFRTVVRCLVKMSDAISKNGNLLWPEFTNNNFNVICSTKKGAAEFLMQCEAHGLSWYNRMHEINYMNWGGLRRYQIYRNTPYSLGISNRTIDARLYHWESGTYVEPAQSRDFVWGLMHD